MEWDKIYQKGKQLNRYPFSDIVSLIFKMKQAKPNLKVLELGCGAGNNVVFMASEGVSVAGIDISKTAIDFAKSRLQQLNLNAELIVGDFCAQPWQDNTFDLVIDRSALNCVPRKQIKQALAEVNRVLKPSGCLYSSIYSDLHPAYITAQIRSEEFTKGLTLAGYQDIDGLYFASKNDITSLFSEFETLEASLNTSVSLEEEVLSATWSITAFKADIDQDRPASY